ncbi:MAG: oxidoreductase [Burkholderiaceae bacterium]|jgi:hypothetical protein|nr:oxidoreductase [Burkholderiaceae bacterium]
MKHYGIPGTQQANDNASEEAAIFYVIKQKLSEIETSTLVRVISVTNDGGVAPVGFVDVQPLVNQIDGKGNAMAHAPCRNIPYFRLQGGTNAIILDPQVGDIGMCVFCSRDISRVKATKAQALPGSWRKFHMSDGIYFGGILNGVPVQYIQYNEGGITIHSPTKITISAPNIEMNASVAVDINTPQINLNGNLSQGKGSHGGDAAIGGTLTADGDVVASGVSLDNHVHSGVQTGGGNTGKPVS